MRLKDAVLSVAVLVTGYWLMYPGLASAEPSPPPPEPKTGIEQDGTYVVGTDIVPGTYASAGPVDGEVCYWKRATSADDGDIIDNAMTKKSQVVRIDPTDGVFVTDGCQPWQQTDPAAAGADLPPDIAGLIGKAKLRHYIDTLNRNAQQFGQVPRP